MSSSPIETPSNSFMWPVPFPQMPEKFTGGTTDAHFATLVCAIRERGYQYAWVDVLCLRQLTIDHPDLEMKRLEEWKVDVPTIGNIYRLAAKVMRYMNGLGVDMKTDLQSWKCPRHWINRAWTLQEIRPEDMIINPQTPLTRLWPVFLNMPIHDLESMTSKTLRQLLSPVHDLAQAAWSEQGCSILVLVKEMSKRSSTNPVDKVAGINYLMWPSGMTFDLPVYDAEMDIDSAWLHCVEVMRCELKLELLFIFPIRRDKEEVIKPEVRSSQTTSKQSRNRSKYQFLQEGYNKLSNATTVSTEVLSELTCRHTWIPTWGQIANLEEDVWEGLPLRVLSQKLVPDPVHPLVVPTFLLGSHKTVGMLCFDDCRLSGARGYLEPEIAYECGAFVELRVFSSNERKNIPPLRTAFYTSIMSRNNLQDFWRGHRTEPQPLTFILSLGLEHNLPLLVCRGAPGICQNSAASTQDISQFILKGVTKYPRTLILEKVAVIHNGSGARQLMERFPIDMPWPRREYDAIFIV